MQRWNTALALGGAVAAGVALVGAQAGDPADLIVHNAVIYTVNAARPRAAAVAVRGGRFVVVGSNAEALRLRGPRIRVVDAAGGAIVPGLQDAHAHFTGLGAALRMLDLRDTASLDEVVALVQKRAASARP